MKNSVTDIIHNKLTFFVINTSYAKTRNVLQILHKHGKGILYT